MRKVIPCGARVIFGGKMEGNVTAICIRFEFVEYEVSYLWDSELKKVWLHETQFELVDKNKKNYNRV